MSDQKTYFLVTFRDPENLKENITLKVGSVQDSVLGLSFVCLSDFIFDTSSTIVKPTEEHLQKKFEHTKNYHLSIYSIISVEEVGSEHQGLRFKKDKSNLLILNQDHNQPH